MAGIQQLRSWFFGITSVIRADGSTGGVRFRKTDKPTQQTMENFVSSTAFLTESSDRAKVSSGATLGVEQGLVVLASDTQAKANATQLLDRSLVVQPHQLPTVTPLANATAEDMPTTVMETTAEVAVTTRNNYQIRPVVGWITWLISRLFKAGGIEGDVPIKTNGTDYNWSWANVGSNTTTVNTIANNANFVSTLLANSSFINSLTTQIITNNPAAITEALEVGFMRIHPITSMPSAKWLRCDGTAISRTTYSTLFSLIGTTYGIGDGSLTFNLPDFRDRQITGYSGTKTIGSTSGTETHTIASTNLPTHTHSIGGSTGTFTGSTTTTGEHGHEVSIHDDNTGITTRIQGAGNDNNLGFIAVDEVQGGGHSHDVSGTVTLDTGNTGNGAFANTAINHLDPYLATNIIIKVLA